MAEWFKAPVLKTGVPARVPWVQNPPLPPVRHGKKRSSSDGTAKISPLKRLANSAAFFGSRKQNRMQSVLRFPGNTDAKLFAVLETELDHRIQFATKASFGHI